MIRPTYLFPSSYSDLTCHPSLEMNKIEHSTIRYKLNGYEYQPKRVDHIAKLDIY